MNTTEQCAGRCAHGGALASISNDRAADGAQQRASHGTTNHPGSTRARWRKGSRSVLRIETDLTGCPLLARQLIVSGLIGVLALSRINEQVLGGESSRESQRA
ncbi:MAG: hypothetical protein ACXIUM_14870 [Wenzhouxiangella sp.]